MQRINRDRYLSQLIQGIGNNLIKIVTGVRRCGKSYLLFCIFRDWLVANGAPENHIVAIDLEDRRNRRLRNPDTLLDYIDGHLEDSGHYYVLMDEIQMVDEFEDVLNSYLKMENVDVFVTGSNSRFLSSDVITEFRGRGHEIRMYPLSFSEFHSFRGGAWIDDWKEYYTWGGLPHVLALESEGQKAGYLKEVFESVYLKDVLERNGIRNKEEFGELVALIASSIGSPCNPTRISNTFKSTKNIDISHKTIASYLDFMQDSFLLEKAVRYDVKGRKYINTLNKYYMVDMGIRGAILDFRQQEETHIMENVIYNELRMRGYSVDVGVVEQRTKDAGGKSVRRQLEVDFVVNNGAGRVYIQSAYRMPLEDKENQEQRPLVSIDDSFRKLIIVGDDIHRKTNEYGITTISLREFLLGDDIMS